MKKFILILVLLLLLYTFGTLAINWNAVAAWQIRFPLYFATYIMPAGLFFIMIIASLLALFTCYIFLLSFSVASERKKYMNEILAQQQLAEDSEKSRIAELVKLNETNHEQLLAILREQHTELLTAQSQLDKAVAVSIESFEDRLLNKK